jgi:hypothetical protein
MANYPPRQARAATPACGFSPDPGMKYTRLRQDGQGNHQGISLHLTSVGIKSAVAFEAPVPATSGTH